MDEILEKYGDRFKSVVYRPQDKLHTWKLTIRGEEVTIDGRLRRLKDTKIFSTNFKGLLS